MNIISVMTLTYMSHAQIWKSYLLSPRLPTHLTDRPNPFIRFYNMILTKMILKYFSKLSSISDNKIVLLKIIYPFAIRMQKTLTTIMEKQREFGRWSKRRQRSAAKLYLLNEFAFLIAKNLCNSAFEANQYSDIVDPSAEVSFERKLNFIQLRLLA